MKRLINTKLFLMLEKQEEVLNLSNQDMELVYDEFAQEIASLCSLNKWNILTYFTMHYARLELERLQASFLSVALQLDISSIPNYPSNLIDYLFVRHNEGFIKVATSAISYMKSSGSYCELYLMDNTIMLVYILLVKVAEHFHSNNFIRIHRSFIINLTHVYSFVGNTLVMEGGMKLAIGREYKKW